MFEEIVKIKPQLDNTSLGQMERRLSQRFQGVAKKFGSGLKSAFVGFAKGALVASAMAAIASVLNPIKEVDDAISKTLDKADNLATKAKQFGVETGKYFKLQQLAQASDLDAGALDMMLSRFQVHLERARSEGKGSLIEFTDEKNVIDAFYKYMASVQKGGLTSDQQALIHADVFGERQVGRASEFLRSDLVALEKRLGLGKSNIYTSRIDSLAKKQDQEAVLRTIRERQDLLQKSKDITPEMLALRDRAERQRLERETDILFKSYQEIADTHITIQEIKNSLQKNTFNTVKEVKNFMNIYKFEKKIGNEKLKQIGIKEGAPLF